MVGRTGPLLVYHMAGVKDKTVVDHSAVSSDWWKVARMAGRKG
jgi:hypothetical protein